MRKIKDWERSNSLNFALRALNHLHLSLEIPSTKHQNTNKFYPDIIEIFFTVILNHALNSFHGSFQDLIL